MFLSRLKIKKIILVGVIWGLFSAGIKPTPVLALSACDLSKVNVYDRRGKDIAGRDYVCLPKEDMGNIQFVSVCTTGQNPCGEDKYVYCKPPDWTGGGRCYAKGVTVEDPLCPTGYRNMYGSQDAQKFSSCLPFTPELKKPVCCKDDGSAWCVTASGKHLTDVCAANDCDCVTKSGSLTGERKCEHPDQMVYNAARGYCVSTNETNYMKVFLCLSNDPNNPKEPGVCDTAIGKITTSPEGFVNVILKFVMGIAGTVALFMLILAGYQVLTSSGDPQKLQASKELIVSVLTGLVLIVFSLVLLRAVGVDILGIPALTLINVVTP